MIYLGFDTSNYTTSVSALDEEKITNIRKLLSVKTGERGLRQSDAVFQHTKQLPDLYSQLAELTDMKKVGAVGVSSRPRSVEGSYMPCFLQGVGYARICAETLGVKLYEFSHQDGHIMAGVVSSNQYDLLKKPFISVHLSGGTCEILKTEYNGYNFDTQIIGGTKDISAGQLIDRIGVKMGFSFPCGKEMEHFLGACQNYVKLPVNEKDGYINFSGIETKALSLVSKENDKELILGTFTAISEALEKALKSCNKLYAIKDVLLVGGVISNSVIRKHLLEHTDLNLYFASREYSCDNAVGIAYLTKYKEDI